MPKNLFVIAIFLTTFLKNANGAIPLAEISLKNACVLILNYTPERLLELARGEKVLPQEIAYDISKALVTDTPALFFPKIDGYPKIRQMFHHDNQVCPAIVSPDGQSIVTRSVGNAAKLWNSNIEPIATFQHDNWVTSAVFSPDGQRILTASRDRTAKLWALNGKLIAIFHHDSNVNSAVFSPDGQFILTASWDQTAKLWNLNENLIAIFHHDSNVNSAVFSPDGQSILTASWDRTAKLWTLNGKPIAIFHHDYPVNSAIFSPDGLNVLTISDDHAAKIWNLNGELIATFHHNGKVDSAIFSPDGLNVLTVSDKSAILWEIHPLWNSTKYRTGQLSLQELATILLILKHKGFVESNPEIQATIHGVLNQIDGNVPAEQKHIKNFFEGFLNA